MRQAVVDAQLDAAGGLAYLGALANNTPSAANILAYAAIVRERAIVRQVIQAAGEIADTAYTPEGRTAPELLDYAEQRILDIRVPIPQPPPTATLEADVLTVRNVRNFRYRSETDYDERWEVRRYDLRSIGHANPTDTTTRLRQDARTTPLHRIRRLARTRQATRRSSVPGHGAHSLQVLQSRACASGHRSRRPS